MANSLLTGVTGLRVHQQMLDVVGNNQANTNTTGFKSQRVRFADLFYQSAGVNVNPMQIGLGARLSGIDTIFQQGTLEATGNDLDMAIAGKGFFVFNGPAEVYSRAGAFGIDQDNHLIDLGTGYTVQRFGTVGETGTTEAFQTVGDNRITIPVGTVLPGAITSSVTLQGNLSATAAGPLAEVLTSAQPFLSGSTPATSTTLLNALQDNTAGYVSGDQIQIQGTDADGTAVNTTLAVDGTTTLGDLLTAINGAFTQSTASLDAAGNLVVTANTTGPAALGLSLSDAGTNTGGTNFSGHSLFATTDGQDGATVNSGIQIFDSQGTPHNLTLRFTKQGPNVWDLTASIPASDGTTIDGSVQGITFADDGSFLGVNGVGAGDPSVSFQFTGIATPQVLSFSFGTAGGFTGLTQFGSPSFAAATHQDGFAPGALTRLSVGDDGIMSGVFSNGRILPIAQLAIATFSNPEGLNRDGDNLFSLTSNSGSPVIGGGGSGDRGSVKQGTLESSNVDVALEFTRLIIAQRGFSVNARTVTVASEVLQELSNIIR